MESVKDAGSLIPEWWFTIAHIDAHQIHQSGPSAGSLLGFAVLRGSVARAINSFIENPSMTPQPFPAFPNFQTERK